MSVHVIGAGLAGLAAACMLVERGEKIVLHEAAKAAGGRARSYHDAQLGRRIDNGNHLLLSGNRAAMDFLGRIGALGTLTGPREPLFPFADVRTARHWRLRINPGRLPWWIFDRNRRVPETAMLDYLVLLKLRRARPDDLVANLLGRAGALYDNFLAPLAVSVLNTMPDVAAAAALRAVLAETIERGGAQCLPCWPAIGLSESFVDPALAWLAARGAEISFGSRVTKIDRSQKTILAVPPWVAAELLPGLMVPDQFEAICNLHFLARLPPGEAGFWGLLGGTAEWAFAKGDILSVTISAANRFAAVENDTLAALVWDDLARVFGLPRAMPPWRLLREKRATFAATPAQLARRPKTRTASPNLMLAGDWTATGLPATIEGAIRSGYAAALAMLAQNA